MLILKYAIFISKIKFKEVNKKSWKKVLKVLILLTAVTIGFLGFWFASKIKLNTEYPILPISSSNMCVFQLNCDGLTNPFERTLHVGDLIIVQGVNAMSVRVAYPNRDIWFFIFRSRILTRKMS